MKDRLAKTVNLSLRETTLLYVLISVALGAGVAFLEYSVHNQLTANTRMMRLVKLSEDMNKTINYLSHEARSYVQERDPKRLANYWKTVNVDKTSEKIISGIMQTGLEPVEMDLIKKVQGVGDQLMREEIRAMKLVDEGAGVPRLSMPPDIAAFELSITDQLLSAQKKKALGKKLLFQDSYENEIDLLKKPIAQFQALVRHRLRSEMKQSRRQSVVAVLILAVLAVVIPVLLAIDITKRKHAEEKLTETNEELERNQQKLLETLEQLRKVNSDLKDTQYQLIQSQKFATIGRLAGMISHEFRNELGVMRNAAFFLKMKWKGADEKVKNHLDILEERIQETDRIIENIFTFAKTRQPLLASTDLSQLIWSSIAKVKVSKNIHIHTELQQNLPRIMADEIQLTRVFVNVILNAAQAMQDRGGDIWVRANLENDYIRVLIEDNGPGINSEDQAHLFEPLFTTKARGAGLGLATAQLLIEGHDGTIDIESEKGKGTVVGIRLPFVSPGEVTRHAA